MSHSDRPSVRGANSDYAACLSSRKRRKSGGKSTCGRLAPTATGRHLLELLAELSARSMKIHLRPPNSHAPPPVPPTIRAEFGNRAIPRFRGSFNSSIVCILTYLVRQIRAKIDKRVAIIAACVAVE